jgi:hypothetical protein
MNRSERGGSVGLRTLDRRPSEMMGRCHENWLGVATYLHMKTAPIVEPFCFQ